MIKSRIQSLIWLLLISVIFIYSDSYFALVLFLLSFIVLIFLGISNKFIINNLEFELGGAATISKAEKDDFYIAASNKSFLPIGKLKCVLFFKNVLTGEKEEKTIDISLKSKSKEKLYWDLKSEYCGNIEIQLKVVTLYDYFGIFKNTINPNISIDVLILPNTFDMDINVSGSQSENLDSPVYSNNQVGIDNTEILGIKEYMPGDDFKNIHWKLTSKLDDVVVKELGSTIENSILIILETSIIKNENEIPSVRDAIMETFISTSKSLIEDSKTHSIGWFDHEIGRLRIEEISSIDDLTGLIRGFLELEKKENIYSTIDYYFDSIRENIYSHTIYITASNPEKHLQDLIYEYDLTVLQCRPSDMADSDMELDYGIIFTPENIEEELYSFII